MCSELSQKLLILCQKGIRVFVCKYFDEQNYIPVQIYIGKAKSRLH